MISLLTFNVNDNVRVRLTDHGRKILREQYEQFRREFPRVQMEFSIDEDAEGWSTWQLWVLMTKLGYYCGLCRELPFETDIQLLKYVPDRSNSGNGDGTSSEIQKSTAAGDQTVQPGTSVSAGSAGSSGLGPDEPIVCGVSSAGPDSGVGSTGPQDPSGGPA